MLVQCIGVCVISERTGGVRGINSPGNATEPYYIAPLVGTNATVLVAKPLLVGARAEVPRTTVDPQAIVMQIAISPVQHSGIRAGPLLP